MGSINVGDLQVGMVLASEVKNMNGQLLMPSGLTINEKHLGLLKAWGITEVEVQGVNKEDVATQAAAQLDPAILAEAEAKTKELFHHANMHHAAIAELITLCTLRKARLLSTLR
jgi:hypothetical protein